MSQLERLIKVLCPNGVTFTELRDVCQIKNGKDWKTQEHGAIPVYGSGGRMEATVLTASYHKPTVLLPRKGSLNVQFVEEPFWNVDTVFYTICDEEIVVPKFLFYFLKTVNLAAISTSSTRPSLTQSALSKIRVPLVPLAVQLEIVRVLDMFTQLEAELEAELEARKIQYAFYNDQILTFSEDIPFVPLDFVILDLRTGLNPRTNFKLNTFDACNYYITVRELAGFSVRTTEKTDQVNDEGLALIQRRARLREGDVLFSGTGTIGRTALVHSQPTDWNIKEGVYALTPNPELITSRFLIHILRSDRIRRRILASADGSTVSSVSMASLRRVKIPLPPREIQDSVVRLLDNFELLINDLSCGLPAEIAARRKQYEFYRDKLLSFKELSA